MPTTDLSPRAAANRENAQKSTGPRTEAGKAQSSRNAVRGALTGRTVLLTSDDLRAYEEHVCGYERQFKPLTAYERGLVQSLADTDWRLQRIPHLLLALVTKGHEDFADSFHHLKPAARAVRIELEIGLRYEKQLRNLQLQEHRLHRRHEKDVAELRLVQRERDLQRGKDLAVAATLHTAAQIEGKHFDPTDLGFDFSTHDVECYLNGQRAAQLTREHRFPPTQSTLPVDPTRAA